MTTQTLHLELANIDDVLIATAVFDRTDPWTWIDDADLRDRLRHRHAPVRQLAVSA